MGRPLISVVVPTYNRPALLERALASLSAQTFDDFEVVVVNDAGVPVDDVVARARGGMRVVLVDHDRNRGRCGTLDTAVAHASGELVAFLDDDDVYYPHHLRTLVDALAGREGVAVYSHAIKVVEDADGAVVAREVFAANDFDADALQITNLIVGMSVLCPLADVRAVGGFDGELRVLEDWDLWLKLAGRLGFEHVPVPTAEYRWRPGAGNQTVREWFRFHEALEIVYRKHPLPDGSPLHAQRERALAGSSGRAGAFSYELSVVVHCGDDLAAALATVEDYAAAFAYTEGVELVLAVPDMAAWRDLVEGLSGDVQAYATGGLDEDEALAFLRGRVSGRRVGHLRAGTGIDQVRVVDLLATPDGTAPIGAVALVGASDA